MYIPFLSNIDDDKAQQESHDTKLHPPTSAEASEEDIEPPVAKRVKLSPPPAVVPKKSGGQEETTVENSSLKRPSKRLKSLSDIPTEMSFDIEMTILEKPATTFATNLQSHNEQQSLEDQEMESCSDSGVYASEKVESLGIFFETTVHNSNLLHVCCQLNESGGGAKTGKATGEERKREGGGR